MGVAWRWTTWWFAAALLVSCGTCSSYDAFAYGGARTPPPGRSPFDPADAPLGTSPDKVGGNSAFDQVQQHIANTKAMVHGAARHARWFNVANGMLLIVTGPFNIIISALTLKLADLMTSAYLSMFGVLLVAMEVPLSSLQRPMREYFKFLYTRFGRAFFLVLVGNLAMVCGKVGFITASLTILNAVLNIYLLGQNKDASQREAGGMSSAMGEVRNELTGQLGGMLAPLRMFGGMGGLMSMLPFGRGKQSRLGAMDLDGAPSAFDSQFGGGAGDGAGARQDGRPGGQSAFGSAPGGYAQQQPRREEDGPGGRSPFSQQGAGPQGSAYDRPSGAPPSYGQGAQYGGQPQRPGDGAAPPQAQYPRQVRARLAHIARPLDCARRAARHTAARAPARSPHQRVP